MSKQQSIPYPQYTTSERDNLIVPEGYKIKNITTGFYQMKNGSGWINIFNDVGEIINITYDELLDAISNSSLLPTQRYRLTDYKTVHYNYPDSSINTSSNIEPLILYAISDNSLESTVYSESYPGDIIYYDINLTYSGDDGHFRRNSVVVPGFKGYIYYRNDVLQGNETHYDFRNVKFRRYKLNPPLWSSYNNYYRYSHVLYDNKVWVSKRHLNNSIPGDDETWQVVYTDLYQSWSKTTMSINYVNIPVDNSDYIDYLTFGDPNNYTYIRFNKIGVLDIEISGMVVNNIIFKTTYSKYTCIQNKIGDNCYLLNFGDNIGSNILNFSVARCTFGDKFSANTFNFNNVYSSIGNDALGNIFDTDIWYMIICDGFKYNKIGTGFGRSIIGSNNIYNDFGYHNQSLFLGDYNSYNIFGNENGGVVGPYVNTAYIDFGNYNKGIIFGDYNKKIKFGNENEYNVFGNLNENIEIGDFNTNNKFGNSVENLYITYSTIYNNNFDNNINLLLIGTISISHLESDYKCDIENMKNGSSILPMLRYYDANSSLPILIDITN